MNDTISPHYGNPNLDVEKHQANDESSTDIDTAVGGLVVHTGTTPTGGYEVVSPVGVQGPSTIEIRTLDTAGMGGGLA